MAKLEHGCGEAFNALGFDGEVKIEKNVVVLSVVFVASISDDF